MKKKIRFHLKRSSKVKIDGRKPIVIPFQTTTILLLFGMIIISGFLFLRSDIFQIKSIKINSEIGECATEEGIKLTTEAVGASIIFYDTQSSERKILDKFYCVESAKISKNYPSTIEISTIGRTPVAAAASIEIEPGVSIATSQATMFAEVFATQSAFFALDKNGIIFQNLATTTALPKVYFGQNLAKPGKVSEKEILWLLNFLEASEKFNLSLGDFIKTSEGYLVGRTHDGFLLILGTEEQPSKTASSLQAILRQAKIEGSQFSILDLRFKKPIIK